MAGSPAPSFHLAPASRIRSEAANFGGSRLGNRRQPHRLRRSPRTSGVEAEYLDALKQSVILGKIIKVRNRSAIVISRPGRRPISVVTAKILPI